MIVQIKLIQTKRISTSLRIVIDTYRILFFCALILVVTCVILFSLSYIKYELNKSQFYILICGFVLSMVCLIFSADLLIIILGWDGLGVLSLFLILFYKTESSMGSSFITFITNRLGDALFLRTLIILTFQID